MSCNDGMHEMHEVSGLDLNHVSLLVNLTHLPLPSVNIRLPVRPTIVCKLGLAVNINLSLVTIV